MLSVQRAIYCHEISSIVVDGKMITITGTGFTINRKDSLKTFQLFGRLFQTFFSSRVPAKEFSISEEMETVDIITGPMNKPDEYGIITASSAVYISKGRTKFITQEDFDNAYDNLFCLVKDHKLRMSGDMINYLANAYENHE